MCYKSLVTPTDSVKLVVVGLTLSQTNPGFYVSAV